MKTMLTLLLLVALTAPIMAQGTYAITGTAAKYPEKSMAYLQFKGQNGFFSDSSVLANGSFSFKGNIDEPRPASIVISDGDRSKKMNADNLVSFFIEPGNLVFTTTSTINKSVITGSPATDDKVKLEKSVHLAQLMNDRGMGSSGITQHVPRGVKSRSSSSSSADDGSTDAATARAAELDEAKSKAMKFITEHPKSFVSLYTLHTLFSAKMLTYPEFFNLLNGLDGTLTQSNAEKAGFN